MSTLLFDIGNTRCKWAVWDEGIRATGVIDNDEMRDAGQWVFADGADTAFACSVATPGRIETVRDILAREDIDLHVATTEHERAGVRCAYPDPTRLGVDRWMAVLAASRLRPKPVLVVDAGTALTIDAVDSDGQHAGGFIIPGIDMMQTALTTRTAQIRIDAPEEINEAFGTSTSEAVRNGALLAAAGACERAAKWLAILTDSDADAMTMAFTGGNGRMLAESLDRAADFHASFVLEGLAIYAGLAP